MTDEIEYWAHPDGIRTLAVNYDYRNVTELTRDGIAGLLNMAGFKIKAATND